MVHNPTTMKSLLGLGRFLNRLVSFRDLCSSRYVLENNCFFFKSVSNKVSVCRHQKTVNTKRLKFLYGDKTWFDLCCLCPTWIYLPASRVLTLFQHALLAQ